MKLKVEEGWVDQGLCHFFLVEDNPGLFQFPGEGLLSPSKVFYQSGSSSVIADKEMLSFQLVNEWRDHGSLAPLVMM